MFYSVEILDTSSPRDSVSNDPDNCSKEAGCIEVLQQRAGSLNI